MKPTTEQILNSLSKLIKENKTELQAEGKVKVELGIIDDAHKLYDKGQNSYASALTGGQSVLVKLQSAINHFEKTENEFAKAEKMAKELGVDMPGKALRNQANEWLKDANKFFSSLKKHL